MAEVTQTNSLQQDSNLAKEIQAPLLVMFSQADCPFCEKLKEEIIQPMLISGDYTTRVVIRELMIDGDDIADFDGNTINPYAVFARYRLYVTPSLLLLDNKGNELAERQIGINTVDYYGYYLDEAIDQALLKLRSNTV